MQVESRIITRLLKKKKYFLNTTLQKCPLNLHRVSKLEILIHVDCVCRGAP